MANEHLEVLTAAADAKIEKLRRPYFALSWYPADGAIFIAELIVNDHRLTPPQGQEDDDGTFLVRLPMYPDGTRLEISWKVEVKPRSQTGAFRGVWAMAKTGEDGKWEDLGSKENPGTDEAWDDDATYIVG